jgi:cytochrome bd ubiquinol oxidase subunit I
MDVLLLSRIQFAMTIAFHYIYPTLSIGLAVILVIMEGMYLITKNKLYHQLTKFWVRMFALIFVIGVATGIVMEFEFGTNWSTYSRYVGDIFGSVLASEGIFAFFLESGFLAILLFGWNKVPPVVHFISTVMVCLGSHFSALWIVIANSWMQTPAGFKIVGEGMEAKAEIIDFWAVVFNPSSMDRVIHVLLGCWQAGATLVLSVSAFYLIRQKHVEFAKASFKIALVVATVSSILQVASGDRSAKLVHQHQPTKLAAMEAHYEASAPADLYLFGWVNEKEERVDFGVRIPRMLSLMVSGDPNTPVAGLRSFPPSDRPPVQIVFQSFHLMVGIGFMMVALNLLGCFLWWKGKLFTCRPVLWAFVFSVLGPQIANQLGWIVAEVGRQPWIVYNLLRTSEGLSKVVSSGMVMSSLVMFTVVYVSLFALFIYLMTQKILKGPMDADLSTPFHTKA